MSAYSLTWCCWSGSSRLRGDDTWHFWRAPIRRKVALCWMAAAVLAVDLLWLEVPGRASRTVGQDLGYYLTHHPRYSAPFIEGVGWLGSFQPIDLLLCTPGAWGCRFLTVAHRVIVAKVCDVTTFVAVRAGRNVDAEYRASFEVASLRQRTLRFADLVGSELFGADLTGADLTGADLRGANLTGADLSEAKLIDAAQVGAASLTQRQLDEACGIALKLPTGLTMNKPCPLVRP